MTIGFFRVFLFKSPLMMTTCSRSISGFFALTLLAVFCLCTAPLTALANTDQTAKIKAIFTDLLDRQISNAAQNGDQRKMQFDGEVTVEPVNDYYAVTLPRLTVLYPNGEKLEIGMVSINVTSPEVAGPLSPGQWKMTLALPSPILGYGKDGAEIMRVSLDSQRAAGIWDESLGNFIKLDAKYSGLKIDFPTSQGHITIPNIAIVYNLTEDNEKRLSGPLSFNFMQSNWDIPALNTKGKIGILAFRLELQRFAASYLKETNGFLPEKIDFANPAFLKAGDGIKATLALGDMQFSAPAISALGTQQGSLNLASGGFKLDISNILSGTADASTDLSFSGLGVSPSPAPGTDAAGDLTALIPARGNIKIMHDNIPVTGISQALANNTGPNAQMAGLAMMLKLPALFSQAGSLLKIEQSSIGNTRYRIDMSGQAKADIAAALSATAEGKMTFAGLDEVIAILQAAPARHKTRPDFIAGLETARAFFENLKQQGKIRPATGRKPEPVYDYDFKLDPSGIFTINGVGATPAPLSPPSAVPVAP